MSIISDILLGISINLFTDRINNSNNTLNQEADNINSPKRILIDNNEKESNKTINKLSIKPIKPDFGKQLKGKFTNLLLSINKSNVYLFMESEPSTHYNLITVVVEDIRTNDWYLFAKPLSFQGVGGGWNNTRGFFNDFKLAIEEGADTELSIRIATSEDIKRLFSGEITFHNLKKKSMPIMMAKDPFLKELKDRFETELVKAK